MDLVIFATHLSKAINFNMTDTQSIPSSPDSETSSWYSTILSSNDTDHEEMNKSQKPEFPKRNPVEFYQMSNPYANSLWYSTTGDKGSEAIGKIQERVKIFKKREVDELIVPPRMESLSRKKVDSPIKNESFLDGFDNVQCDSPKFKGLSNIHAETPYRKALQELIETEIKYQGHLSLVNTVYRALLHNSRKYRNILNQAEEAVIFGNIDTIIDLSQLLVRDLLKGIQRYTLGNYNKNSKVQEQISASEVESFDIGESFDNLLNRIKIGYGSYFQNHQSQLKQLKKCSHFGGPKVKKWLDECAFLAKAKSDCWDLESLLIKPIQRLTKYTLLLDRLLASCCDDISFEYIQHLCDAKAHLEILLREFNQTSTMVDELAAPHTDAESAYSKVTTRGSSLSKKEYAVMVKEFKLKFTHLQAFKREVIYSLRPLLMFLDDHKKFAECWQAFMEHDDNVVDERYIKSIYSSYIEKVKDQQKRAQLVVVNIKETIVKAFDLAIEHCNNVRVKINKHSTYRAAYKNYINKEKSKGSDLQHFKATHGTIADAQEYVVIENEILDEVPVLNAYLEEFLHYIVLSYHRIILMWLKDLSGEAHVVNYKERLDNGTLTMGNNFDIVELYSISRYHTKMALEDLSLDSPSSKVCAYRDKNIDTTIRIYQSRVIRRLFGTC